MTEIPEEGPTADQVDGMVDVWTATVDDGAFVCNVTQTNKQVVHTEGDKLTFDDSATTGILQVHTRDGDLVFQEDVTIRAGAIFGPDVEDVVTWQNMCIGPIDKWIEDHEAEGGEETGD